MERDKYIDTLKFVLIFLVVLGHVIAPYIDDPINRTAKNFIFLFHMPLFIFISGYFSKTTDYTKFKKSILRLFETLLIFQLIYRMPDIINLSFSWQDLITPRWTLWYLLSLIFWKIFVFYIPKNIKYINVIWVSILCSLLVGFIPVDYTLSFQRTFVFLPFFILGYYSDKLVFDKIKSIPKLIPYTILIATIALFYLVGEDFSPIMSGSNSYYFNPVSVQLSFLFRLLFLLFAFVLSISVINIVPTLTKISALGKDTLLYYLYHGFAVILLNKMVDIFHIPTNFLALLIYATIIMLGIFVLSKFKISSILLNPISYFLKKQIKIN
ncbi:MAG: acyltransferase family protein [Bacteroidales bacterium]|jgi:fucose 4-O-acetylase-like acetyltransferase|nr:acyltransferase family protein [Bacteroidales bacterium]